MVVEPSHPSSRACQPPATVALAGMDGREVGGNHAAGNTTTSKQVAVNMYALNAVTTHGQEKRTGRDGVKARLFLHRLLEPSSPVWNRDQGCHRFSVGGKESSAERGVLGQGVGLAGETAPQLTGSCK